jgi:malonate-semialdehyde dehydrogenase (acetylating)/methylmalonate-semialdehyde dehydrogenase
VHVHAGDRPVGQKTAEEIRERLLQEIPKLRIGVATDPDAQIGPVVTAEHKKKIEGYIQLAIDEGASWSLTGGAGACRAMRRAFSCGRP